VVPVNKTDVSPTKRETAGPVSLPRPPEAEARRSGWTGGRIAALVIGALLALISLGLLAGGATAMWADVGYRDAAGYVTTDVHEFSTAGSALATESVELGSPGVGWLYSAVVFGEVRIRVSPVTPGTELFVGIAPTGDVDRFLAGVNHTVISDFWTNRTEVFGGDAPASVPGTQDFWVASASGTGAQTLTWDPDNGSWTVVVMNADGQPAVNVTADLGATMPSLIPIAVAALVVGGVFLVGGAILIVGAIRRANRTSTV
jgi:hypothetical protein